MKEGPSKNISSFLNTTIVESANHKVVIVLDRSPKFATPIQTADISFSLRDEQSAPINGKLGKLLWNCSTEAIMEFHRVVGDLFPQGQKQIRLVTSDYVGKFLTDCWSEKLLSKKELINALKGCEPPQASGDATSCSILNGILFALEAVSERTPLQRKTQRKFRSYLDRKEIERPEIVRRGVNIAELVKQTGSSEIATTMCSSSSDSQATILLPIATRIVESSCSHEEGEIREQFSATMDTEESPMKMATIKEMVVEDGATKIKAIEDGSTKRRKQSAHFHLQNRGTIVVITSIDSLADYDSINEYLAEQILARNESSRTSVDKKMVNIEQIDLIVLNIATNANAPNAILRGKKSRPFFNSRLISVAAGHNVIPGVHKILQDIYDLVSTTVVGIPMKEETQQGQSVNYDVEMLHPRATHFALHKFHLLNKEGNSKMLDCPSAHGGLFSSVRLKWCTPTLKLKSEIFPLLQDTFPIAPAHVHNRASVCLTTFLQNGKNVMLELFPEAYQDDRGGLALSPNLKDKLISHYLSKNSDGQLLIHCVGIGEKATLGGNLSSAYVYGAENCSAQSATKLNLKAMTQLVHAAQIQPVPLEKCSLVEDNVDSKDYGELQRQMGELADGISLKLTDSFIYNIPEKFEPLLSLIHKPGLSADQFEQCRVEIQRMVTARDGKEPLTDKTFDCALFLSGSTATATKDEQYRVAFDELCRLLHRLSGLSQLHQRIYEMFIEASGVRPKEWPKSSARKRAIEDTSSKLDEEQQMKQRIKRRKDQLTTYWKPGEEINLYDWWLARYNKEFWSSWKGDFEGRKKYGDKAQEHLYPNLKLPHGQSKAAGTGTAGPIE